MPNQPQRFAKTFYMNKNTQRQSRAAESSSRECVSANIELYDNKKEEFTGISLEADIYDDNSVIDRYDSPMIFQNSTTRNDLTIAIGDVMTDDISAIIIDIDDETHGWIELEWTFIGL